MRLILCIFSSYPLALLNYYIKSPTFRLWYGMLTWIILHYTMYGNIKQIFFKLKYSLRKKIHEIFLFIFRFKLSDCRYNSYSNCNAFHLFVSALLWKEAFCLLCFRLHCCAFIIFAYLPLGYWLRKLENGCFHDLHDVHL